MRKYDQSIESIWLRGFQVGGILLIGALSIIGLAMSANETENQGTAPEGAGKLLFSDDFSSSKSGWDRYSTGEFLAAYKNGSYILTAVPVGYWNFNNHPRLNLTDFIVEVEARKVSGPDDNAFGLAFRVSPGSYYAFLLSSDGYYDFRETNNYTWMDTQNWTKSEAIKTGSQANLIKLVAKGDKFSFYANGEKLEDFVDDTLVNGSIGLYACSQSEGNVSIAYDNFKVWSLKE